MCRYIVLFFFNDTATTEIYTLSLHDALPISRGRVMTYGQVAALLGEGYTPRTVGFVMHSSDGALPWHRVINAQGACSTGGLLLPADKQQRMLERAGVKFDERHRCDLGRYLWTPPTQQEPPKT